MKIRSLVGLVLLLASCQHGGKHAHERHNTGPQAYTGDALPPVSQQGEPTNGGVLRVAMEAEPPSLNYQLDPLDAWAKLIDNLINESLARPNPKTWVPEPRLATSWDISPDKLTFTFHLRKNVRWQDGVPFTADDVVFTFDKLLAPTSKTMAVRSYLEPLASYKKLDKYTVQFHLKRPYWLAFDAIAEVFIYPKHIYDKGDFNTHPANRAPIGTGQFKFVRWKTGDEIVLARNDDYFGPKAHLDRIIFKYAPDPTVRMQMLRRGDLDVVLRLSPDAWRELTNDPSIAARYWRLRHVPSGLQWIGWNEARPMFRDVRVRRALTMLIDRQDIVHNLRLGLDTVAVSWFYPGSPEYNAAIKPLPYDPDAAKDLLDDAGWRDTDGDGIRDKNGVPFSFTFLYPVGNPFYEQLASLMRNELGKAGIHIDTSRLEWAVYTERLRRHEFDACSLLWQIDPRDDPYQIWHSSEINGGSNFIGFADPQVDHLLEKARTIFNTTQRVALYKRFSRILHREQPYTMLFNRYNLSLVSKKLGGIYSSPYGIVPLGDLYVRKVVAQAATPKKKAAKK